MFVEKRIGFYSLFVFTVVTFWGNVEFADGTHLPTEVPWYLSP